MAGVEEGRVIWCLNGTIHYHRMACVYLVTRGPIMRGQIIIVFVQCIFKIMQMLKFRDHLLVTAYYGLWPNIIRPLKSFAIVTEKV